MRLHATEEVVELEISDNGQGFDSVQVAQGGGQGLGNMRERVARLSGEFTLESAPGERTTIRVRVGIAGNRARPDGALALS